MDKKVLKELLEKGKTHREIAKITGFSKSNVGYWILKYNLNKISCNSKNEILPTNFLSPIDTKEKAYLVGFILGDGYISDEEHVEITQAIANEEVIKFLSEVVNGKVKENRIFDRKKRLFPNVSVTKKIPKIKMVLGGRLKTERHFPRVKAELMPYLVRGLFDADGCFSYGIRKDRNRLWVCISFTHHLKCLTGLQKFLLDKLNIATTVRMKSKENCYILEFSSRKNVFDFLCWLYQDESFIPLKYKYNKFNAVRLELEEFGENCKRSIPSRAIEHNKSIEGVETRS
ncbi:LAGLIDADG family homing endonuclease [Megamonas funiformis]|uniref:LAGLIDADG family homing endonuclease n=1 Tax=Megamonas funiformis TaxID=437897 RepID=UPI003F86B2A5